MAVYLLSDEATVDLDRLYAHGILNFGLRQADAYFDAMLSRFRDIADKPERYATVDHIRQGYRRCVFRSHAVYYRLANDQVIIVRILGRQDTRTAL
jgi:toxin ParE1/3/4